MVLVTRSVKEEYRLAQKVMLKQMGPEFCEGLTLAEAIEKMGKLYHSLYRLVNHIPAPNIVDVEGD